MYEDVSPPDAADDCRYRTVEFDDGLIIFDRQDTAGWIHSDLVVPLTDAR
jgi:hypothetical protein